MSIFGQRWPRGSQAAVPGSATPEGPAGGDLTGEYPDPVLIDVVGPGEATKVTVDAQGRVIVRDTLDAGDIPVHTHNIADVTGLDDELDLLQAEIDDLQDQIDAAEAALAFHWEPVTNGDAVNPEVLFDDDGDIIMAVVPN